MLVCGVGRLFLVVFFVLLPCLFTFSSGFISDGIDDRLFLGCTHLHHMVMMFLLTTTRDYQGFTDVGMIAECRGVSREY